MIQPFASLAPLDAYRVVVQVDERDIGHVQSGQTGALALTGMPADPLPLSVTKLTPVAVSEEGRNYFRVEEQPSARTSCPRGPAWRFLASLW